MTSKFKMLWVYHNMLRVCHITSVHPRYDSRIFIKQCVTLATAKNQACKVSLVVADGMADEIRQTVAIYSVAKPTSRLQRMCVTSKLVYQKVISLQPDVVHVHDPELLPIAAKLARQNYTVIYDAHEDLPKQMLSKYWLPKLFRPLLAQVALLMEKHYAPKLYGIVAATPIIAKRFMAYNAQTISVCNYPWLTALTDTCHPVAWQDRTDKLCYIGSISRTRGIVPLVQALSLSELTLELAGIFSGDINLELLQQLSGGDLVNYLGVLSQNEIVALLRRVKIGLVTLLPTPSYMEALPIKLFEYMAAGIPVIASDFPLWRDIVLKHNCGFVVDPHDSAAIAKYCTQLINDAALAQTMGNNGQQAVRNYFNWETEAVKLCAFYAQIAAILR